MAMPDRGKTRPYLLEQVNQAERDVRASQAIGRALGAANPLLPARMAALALAGTVLALADAEWAREEAAARPAGAATQGPTVTVERTGKPIY